MVKSVKSHDDGLLVQALAAHGEMFMSMFDDHDEQQPRQQARKDGHPDQGSDKSSRPKKRRKSGHVDTNPGAGAISATGGAAAGAAASPSSDQAVGAAGKGQPDKPSKLDMFLYSAKKGRGPAKAGGLSHQRQQQQQEEQAEQQRLIERQLRKQFMSSKVVKIFDDSGLPSIQQTPAAADASVPGHDFQAMKREVELFGGSALDKHSKKAWRARMLSQMGAAAEKGPRHPAKIGKGLARAAAQREAKALQEAIDAGLVKVKGRGKQIRREAAKQRDKGLMEAGKGFKNGVLRLPKKTADK